MRNIVLVCMLAAFVAACGGEEVVKKEVVRPVRAYTVNGQVHKEVRTFPGKVEAAQQAGLAFRISGEIVKLAVKQGDKVEQGQLIAMLDQRDFLAAESDLHAQLVGARSVLKEAKLNIERNRKLLTENIISQSTFDSAQSSYETSRAKVLSLEQSLKRAQLNVQYARLEAPFTGTIAVTHVDNHEFVQANEPIVQLENNKALDVVINVPESYWAKVQRARGTGEAAAVARFEAFPGQEFKLKLKEFQTTANSATQTYEVTLSMELPGGIGIAPGMTAEVEGSLMGAAESAYPTVPFSSVAGGVEEGKHVFILDDANVVQKRGVVVGSISGDMIEVKEGIERGERVVSAGVNYLHEGQQVRILEGRIGGRE